jgi:hypothetical protein
MGIVLMNDVAQAQVEPVTAQGAQAGREPVDLLVPVQGGLSSATRCPARGGQAVGQLGGRLRQGLGDRREVRVVVGDEAGSALGIKRSDRAKALVVWGFT